MCSIAGNLTDCDVENYGFGCFCRRKINKTIVKQLCEFEPDLVGLSAMTFQYDSAVKVAQIVREWNLEVPIVLGG